MAVRSHFIMKSLLHFSILQHLVTKYILRKTNKQQFHWRIVWMEILETFHTWICFSFANSLQKSIKTNEPEPLPQKTSSPPWGCAPPSNTSISESTPITTPRATRSPHAILHNYTTKSPLVTMGCHTFTLKIGPSHGAISIPIYLPHTWTQPTDHPKHHPDSISHFLQYTG